MIVWYNNLIDNCNEYIMANKTLINHKVLKKKGKIK